MGTRWSTMEQLVPSFLPITTQACLNKFMSFSLEAACIKFTVSKALGYAILAGAVAVKLPQLFNIQSAGTVDGLASSAYLLELASYTIFGMYNFRKGYAFSTFGENVFLALQNLVLLYCFLVFPAKAGGQAPNSSGGAIVKTVIGLGFYAAMAACLHASISPTRGQPSTLELVLVSAPSALTLMARVPQIWSNFSNKSVGVLSLITQTLNTLGCLARVFTTAQEVDDLALLATMVLAFVLNSIIFMQIFLYPALKADVKTNTKKD